MIKAVIFDFDGLIIDTETAWYQAFSRVYADHGEQLPLELFAQCIGTLDDVFDPYVELERRLGKTIDRDALRKRAGELHAEIMADADLRPGVRDYLDAARQLGLGIALASSSPRSWIDPYLERYHLKHYFHSLHTGDTVKRVKPDPELYVRALDSLGVSGNEALAFEDSENGLRAALGAGLRCVVVPNEATAHLAFDGASLRLGSMAELPLAKVLEAVA
ncbi:HAD family hydrolase [Paenibacillus thermoaerophilus]|uniref:HAD family hydrolase n=1 Tax=Paenibacillus thermoaerophilus TaxID=1215385 RepID=A0ABW2V5K2_9BACL|nr:HAD family hydrolase [Paenibacillus thermoaerophilus]TMV18825.1 HAD family hydrolase [Paenibacillus thermoaerophilus]